MPSDQTAHGCDSTQAKSPPGAMRGTGGESVLCSYCSGDGGRTKESGHKANRKRFTSLVNPKICFEFSLISMANALPPLWPSHWVA